MSSHGSRGQWSEVSLKNAVRRVLIEGVSKKTAAREGNIPRGTLQRHIKKAQSGMGIVKKLGRPCVLTAQQEDDLVERILDMEARLYGLTTQDIRTIVYRFCEQYNI